MLRFYLSCLLAFTGGHMVNYTVILYLQEKVGSDWLSGGASACRSAAPSCSAGLPVSCATALHHRV